jgi:hypothetical protein
VRCLRTTEGKAAPLMHSHLGLGLLVEWEICQLRATSGPNREPKSRRVQMLN